MLVPAQSLTHGFPTCAGLQQGLRRQRCINSEDALQGRPRQTAGKPGFSWWENQRWNETHVVIWAEAHHYAVFLAKRSTQEGTGFYLLKTAYCLRERNIRKFTRERDAWREAQKD